MFFFHRKKKNVPQRLKELFSPLEKDYAKALIFFDERGVELYSYVSGSFSIQKDLHGLLNMFFSSERIIKQVFSGQHLDKFMDYLNYFTSSVIVKFGIYRIYLVRNRKFFILYIVDEYIKSPDITTTEKTLKKKLEEIREKEIIEDYSSKGT